MFQVKRLGETGVKNLTRRLLLTAKKAVAETDKPRKCPIFSLL
jgi:hypothetical protein